MNAYTFEISCPICGGEVAHVTGGNPEKCETRSIARCVNKGCEAEMIVVVTLVVRERYHDDAVFREKARQYKKQQRDRKRELRVLVQ